MAEFLAQLKPPTVRYIEERDAEGAVIGAYPVAQVRLVTDGEPHDLSERLAEMVGKRVRVSIVLEQAELPFTQRGCAE